MPFINDLGVVLADGELTPRRGMDADGHPDRPRLRGERNQVAQVSLTGLHRS